MECVLNVLWDAGILWLCIPNFGLYSPSFCLSLFLFLTQFLKFIYIYYICVYIYSMWVLSICLSHLLFLGLQINGRSHMTPTPKLRAL